MKLRDFLKIYILILAVHIMAQIVSQDLSLIYFTKLLMPISLLLYNFYFNSNKLSNIFITTSFSFFLLGNTLMIVNPTYDPCRFDAPMLSYAASFAFLAVLPLSQSSWSLQNIFWGLAVAAINVILSFLYVINRLDAGMNIFYLFVATFTVMSFTTFLHRAGTRKKVFVILGLVSISISNHILGFCTFIEKTPVLVPLAMMFYGSSLLFFMIGYADFDETLLKIHSKDGGDSNS